MLRSAYRQADHHNDRNYQPWPFSPQITGVSILRAGETMEQALTAVCKDIRLGKILIQTNHDTGEPEVEHGAMALLWSGRGSGGLRARPPLRLTARTFSLPSCTTCGSPRKSAKTMSS